MVNVLNWITEFLQGIRDLFQSLFHFLLSSIKALLVFLKNLPNYLSILFSSVSWLPTFAYVFALLTIAVAVLFIVLGRKGDSG